MNNVDLPGAWTASMYAEHLPEFAAFDQGLIEYITQVCHPQKVLDLGCGQGFFVKYLRDIGIDAWGVEAEDLTSVFKAPGYQIQQDLSHPFDLNERYDLVICLEVVEHIHRKFEDIVFDNIVKHMSKYLLFSGATPGQQGTGHINERLQSHWFSQLSKRGLTLRHQDSVHARLNSRLPWYIKNVSLWEMIHPQAYNYDYMIAERDTHILEVETALHQIKNQTNNNIAESAEQLKAALAQIESLQNKIDAMESSKFWKLRKQWFKAKRIFGLGT
ncbi:MAG: methyltransferase domain-containing protein [Calothrix sp. C42_A2020_038]|nr:methyltransferase domain-containing protein [Calothrix sp. C42_A2020_038]